MNRFRFGTYVLTFLLTAVGARAQQNAAPIELARLTNGAIVSFVTSGCGLGIEINGGDTPSLSQPRPAWIEVFHSEADIRQISGAYKTVSKEADDVVALADLVDGPITFHIEDRWSAKGTVVSVHRTVTVAGNGAGGFYSALLLNSSPNVGPIDYFIPAGTYRGRGGATNAAPLSYVFREENPAAPMIGMFFRNGSSITMLNPAPRADTTFEDINPHRSSTVLIDERMRFGIFNSTPAADGAFALGYWYPGSNPGPTAGEQAEVDPAVNPAGGARGRGARGGGRGAAGGPLRRYHPIKDGLSQNYTLSFRFGSGETFPEFERNTWRWAWDTLHPQLTKLDVELVRKILIDHLADRVTTIDGAQVFLGSSRPLAASSGIGPTTCAWRWALLARTSRPPINFCAKPSAIHRRAASDFASWVWRSSIRSSAWCRCRPIPLAMDSTCQPAKPPFHFRKPPGGPGANNELFLRRSRKIWSNSYAPIVAKRQSGAITRSGSNGRSSMSIG